MEPTRRHLLQAFAALGASITPAALPSFQLRAAPQHPGNTRVPVLVELFTSQGCSSCPPADTLLARLVEEQPISGVEVVGLSHHVDYWNRLGWTDPYSSAAATERQVLYQRRFQTNSVYTPQMVVDGEQEFVGSDVRKALSTIRGVALAPRHRLAIESRAGGLSVTIAASGSARPWAGEADLWIAAVHPSAGNAVPRGENRGRTLEHRNVVETLERAGTVRFGDQAPIHIPAPAKSKREGDPHLVAFLQERRTLRVLAVAPISVSR